MRTIHKGKQTAANQVHAKQWEKRRRQGKKRCDFTVVMEVMKTAEHEVQGLMRKVLKTITAQCAIINIKECKESERGQNVRRQHQIQEKYKSDQKESGNEEQEKYTFPTVAACYASNDLITLR
jgi:hypothetical protein